MQQPQQQHQSSRLGLAIAIITGIFLVIANAMYGIGPAWFLQQSPRSTGLSEGQAGISTTVEKQGVSGNPRWVERKETGSQQTQVYTVTLAANEALVGDAVDVNGNGVDRKCVVFAMRGPSNKQFTVIDGAWDRYTNVSSDGQYQQLIQDRLQLLTNHVYCKTKAVPVVELK